MAKESGQGEGEQLRGRRIVKEKESGQWRRRVAK